MTIVSRGLAFDYEPSKEELAGEELIKPYVVQKLYNFGLVEYYKKEGKIQVNLGNGFMQMENVMIFQMSMIDGEPRRMIFDWGDQKIYRVSNTPLNPLYKPSERRLVSLKVNLINSNMLRFDVEFLRAKYNELVESLNGDFV